MADIKGCPRSLLRIDLKINLMALNVARECFKANEVQTTVLYSNVSNNHKYSLLTFYFNFHIIKLNNVDAP